MPRASEPSETAGVHGLPVDADVSREEVARERPRPRLLHVLRDRWDILLAIALGGVVGSLGRWSVGELLPHDTGRFAWSTFTVNVTGAFLLGLLMAFMVDVLAHTRYVRPLLGVGVLGGWTTFSTYMFDARAMLADGRVASGLFLYVGGTLVVGLVAVWLGLVVGRTTIAVGSRRR